MITALQARELVEISDKNVAYYMEQIDLIIRQAAEKGERRIPLYVDGLRNSSERPDILIKKPTPIQTRVIDYLKRLGFGAKLSLDGDQYVPPGCADDYGNGPLYTNVVIVVSW